MAQRLELKQIRGKPEDIPGRRWYFESGRRTLGRASDCNWHIPDPQRLVSKLHCTIEADRDGFVLRDNSANGSKVDGRTVLDGDTVRLAEGSVIEIGDFAFSVKLTGEKDAQFEDPEAGLVLGEESLTISSILADVAPKSGRSSGLYGSHDAAPEERSAKNVLSSRNVEIGWRGPPDTSRPKPVLPVDWDAESDFGNTVEHGRATRVSAPIARVTAVAAEGVALSDMALDQSLVIENSEPLEPIADTQAVFDAGMMQLLEAAIGRNERACLELFEILGIAGEAPKGSALTLPPMEAAVVRLETLLAMQNTLATALNGLIDEMGRRLEPSAVEAQADAAPAKHFWRRENAYWQAYKSHFDGDSGRVSLRDLFREAMLNAMRAEAVRFDRRREQSEAGNQ